VTAEGADDRWQRARGLVDIEALAGAHVVVAGLGSGGSTVALELAKAGVGRFTLIDPDTVEAANLIRHECDDRYLGWPKAEAVGELIRHRNPHAQAVVVTESILDLGDALEEAVADASLVAACTDVEPPKHLLNRLCVLAGVPAVYAGVYERGVGGEVVRCGGGPDEACYACITSVLKQTAVLPDGDDQLDYGMVGADGTLHGTPGLGLDVRLVALIHAKLCLLELLGRQIEHGANVVLFGTERVEALFPRPFASALINVSAQQDCLLCALSRAP
jgi:molybdopterin/thiamine biosynthesis adenylyltransferase